MRILIVDDFEMIRTIMKKTLFELGFKGVDQAENGKQALELLNAAAADHKPYDLVFVDWNMPVMSGLELLQACKKDESLKNIPIIMVTAESDRAYVLEALMSGAADYVVKPFSPGAIARKIESLKTSAGRKAS